MKVTGFIFHPPKNKLHKKYKAMKIIGYLTQCCNQIKTEDEVYGIEFTQDIFNKFDSLKTIPPEKSKVHFCNECYQEKVINAADKIVYKKKYFDEWVAKSKELAFIFKQSCMNNKTTKIVSKGSDIINNELPLENQEIQPILTKKHKNLGKSNH